LCSNVVFISARKTASLTLLCADSCELKLTRRRSQGKNFGSEGCRFESCPTRHYYKVVMMDCSYGGFRLREAWNITWADCDFNREEIIVNYSNYPAEMRTQRRRPCQNT